MNNIEELKKAALGANLHGWTGFEDALNDDGYSEAVSKFIGHCRPSEILALIAQLEAAQKETGVYSAISEDVGAIVTLLQGNEWAEHVAKTNVGGALEQEITRLINSITDLLDRAQTAEAALSAANERLSKPVVLPPRRSASSFVDEEFSNKDLAAIYNAARVEFSVKITNAGFTVEGG